MIKVVIFDLDGVLVDSCDLHFHAFNQALDECGCVDKQISYEEHLNSYNGKPTGTKLTMLTHDKGLDKSLYDDIWRAKQRITYDLIQKYEPDLRIISILKQLREEGFKIFCASNSIWNTLKTILLKKGFLDYIDYFISNEEVKQPKPNAEIYHACLTRANVSPQETLIIEDSEVGFCAAIASGAHVLKVRNTHDVTYDAIMSRISSIYAKPRLNIVIPMAGYGSRFAQKGYKLPKPLIEIHSVAMISWVVDNLSLSSETAKFIFICRQEHREDYNLDSFLSKIAPNCSIISVDGVTDGAARTVLLAKDFINNDDNLIIANSDQFLEWNADHFLQIARSSNVDGLISTFTSTHPKWSYAREHNGFVSEVAEKNPISNKATTGIYFWKRGRDFVQCAESMIRKDIRVNNEFYVSPVFNQAILEEKKIATFDCKRMWGLGTPEDLTFFLDNYHF
jgi:HAD superfamily hydrolase (TIGR01509 family)